MLLDIFSRVEMGFSPFEWIRDLLGYILNVIYILLSKVGIENAAVCIIVFTIIIKLAMLPTSYKQQKSQKLNSVVQPEITKITNKYKNKKDNASMIKQQNEIQAVYDKYGTSPTSGCLTSLVTMLVIFALYRVIYNIHEYIQPINGLLTEVADAIKNSGIKDYAGILETFANENKIAATYYNGGKSTNDIVSLLSVLKPEQWESLQEVFSASSKCANIISQNSAKVIDINSFVGGMNIKDVPTDRLWPGILIPILALLTQLYSIHQMTKKTMQQQDMKDNPMMQSMMTMNRIMPLFSFFICLSMPIGIGIYWILGSVVQIIQTFFFDRHFSKMDVDQLVKENIEKASKKRASGKKSYMQRLMEAQQNLEEQNQKTLKDYAHISSKSYSEKSNNVDIDNDGNLVNYKKGSISSYANIMKTDNGK